MGIQQYKPHLDQLVELHQKQTEIRDQWFRQLLTLAAGGLALLAGLGPKMPAGMGNTGRIALACTWVFLGVGIIAGGFSTYLEVKHAELRADGFRKKLISSLQNRTMLKTSDLIVEKPNKFFLYSRNIMVSSLLLAVCCLVLYATMATLSG